MANLINIVRPYLENEIFRRVDHRVLEAITGEKYPYLALFTSGVSSATTDGVNNIRNPVLRTVGSCVFIIREAIPNPYSNDAIYVDTKIKLSTLRSLNADAH